MLLPLLINLLSLIEGHHDAELLFVGDAMQHQAQIDAARRQSTVWDYSECFTHIASKVRDADFAVVNLETPLGPPPYTGYPCFNAPGLWAKSLSDAGFDLFLTANNHTLDRRDRGLSATIDTLDRYGVRHIGTYASVGARTRAIPAIVKINGIKIAFLNYTYGTNGFEPGPNVVVDYIDRRQITSDIASSRLAGAEIICVCVHWGDEYRLSPNQEQKSIGSFLESLGVDIIIGGHPHVVQPLEFRDNLFFPHKKVFIAWSLGNFISNMKTADTRGGLMARVRLHRGDDGIPRLESGDYELLFTVPAGTPSGSNFRVVPARTDSVIPPQFIPNRDAFLRNATSVMSRNIDVPEKF